jgi:hypothetical protein
MELTIETRVQESLTSVRDKAKLEAEEGLKLKVMEKEHTIASMQKQIEELKRKAEQGSQQLQGEVQELEIESMLREHFPRDTITPVPKGEHAAMPFRASAARLGKYAAGCCGNQSAPRTGMTAGWRSSETTSAPPKPK